MWQPICSLPDAVAETQWTGLEAVAAGAHRMASCGARELGRQIKPLRCKDPALWERPAEE